MPFGPDVFGQLPGALNEFHTHFGQVVVDRHVGGDVEDVRFPRVTVDPHFVGDVRVVADDVTAFVDEHLGALVVGPLAHLVEADVETQALIDGECLVGGPDGAQGEQNRRIVGCEVARQRPPGLQSEGFFARQIG